MGRTTFFLFLCCCLSGCLRPLRTDSRITVTRPLDVRLSATIPPKDNACPLVAMPVDGDCCRKGPKIAVLDVDGLLLNQNLTGPYSAGENPVDLFREKLDAAAADPSVAAVVLRVNSPGGGTTATDVMWRDLLAFRQKTGRPVVACLMDLACGGAYYLATAADQIVAHPTTVTGGIGVIMNLYNLQDFMGTVNIVSQPIKAGTNIDMGRVTATLTPPVRQMLQAMAEEMHRRFQDVVRQRRPALDLAGGTTFDGRVFTATQALERKLIDRVGYLEEAIELARELGGQPGAQPVLLHRPTDPARTAYAITPNVPLQASFFPFNMPGADRNRLPTFLYLWAPDPTVERLSGR